MKKLKSILILLVAVIAAGCSGTDNERQENNNTATEQQTESKTEYTEYCGYWSYEGKSHDQILAEGGVELSCTITEDGQFSGTLYSQQENTGRFASIEDISGKIGQAEIYFDYADDEWGNSGTLHIQFLSESIYVEVLNYKSAGSDYGIGGSYELIREKEYAAGNDIMGNDVIGNDVIENDIAGNGIVEDSDYDPSWTEEEIINTVNERSQYYRASAYYPEITDYWENVRGVRDISNVMEPLFETDRKYYTAEDFENEPMLVIHLAKNEIYARHGYIFTNEDLQHYFMGCIWYNPTCAGTDFDDGVFNEYEKVNLEILAELDTY